jgi:hypothetical protein
MPPALLVLNRGQRHNVGRRTSQLKQLCHSPHRRTRMGEEQLQAGAKVVLAWLAVTRECEPVLRTSAVAQRPDLTTLALRGKRIALVVSELALFGRGYKLQHVGLVNIAEPITRLDEVIAGVKVAIMLQRRAVAASRCMDAKQMPAEISLERHVEELNVNTAHVVTHPLLKDIHEKPAVLFAPHRAFRY